MRIIGGSDLNKDAVVPQGLDNQFVGNDVLQKMVRAGDTYEAKWVSKLRERAIDEELIRSLVYSSQTVIQRAWFKNNESLFKHFSDKNESGQQAFAQLIKDDAIVPFLLGEESLAAESRYDTNKNGQQATEDLLKQLQGHEIQYVRLAQDAEQNKIATTAMSSAFGERLEHVRELEGAERAALAQELFHGEGPLDPETFREFSEALDELGTFAQHESERLAEEGEKLARNDVYAKLFAVGGEKSNIVLGRFRRDVPFLPQLKQYVDLVYNCNLPDHLGRYTFTPANLPSRMALQDPPEVGGADGESLLNILCNTDLINFLRRTFVARSQKAMSLPHPADLSVSDVAAIRELPEWAIFKQAQVDVLDSPTSVLYTLEAFEHAFGDFQHALSSWHRRKHRRRGRERVLTPVVSLALDLGGRLIPLGSDPRGYEHAVGQVLQGLARVPVVTRFAAKLIIGSYDGARDAMDRSWTHSVELLQSENDLYQQDIEEILRKITRDTSPTPWCPQGLADQGIK